MAIDRHVGRSSPTFVVEGDPDTFIGLIRRHGVLSRVMRSRKCPCITTTGSPNIHCMLCRGDGYVFDFQRKLLQADEDCEVRKDRSVVLPFRVPILEPVSVERLLPPEQGNIKKYVIDRFDAFNIYISGSPLPLHWQKLRVSYYFDRYNSVVGDLVEVDAATKTLTTTLTKYDGEHRIGNVEDVHGDLAIITRIYDAQLDHTFSDFTFRKNRIQLSDNEPTPTPGKVEVDYFYVPPTQVLPSDLESQDDKEKWMSDLTSGTVRVGLEPWYELSEGDLVTILVAEYFRDEVIVHSSVGVDKLNEFDISRIDDEIFDEDGVKYRKGIDYYLRPFRDLVWIGSQPNQGKRISVRYGYHPTFSIFINNPVPNNLENKRFPKIFMAKYYSMTLPKDLEKISSPEYAPESSESTTIPEGFTEL